MLWISLQWLQNAGGKCLYVPKWKHTALNLFGLLRKPIKLLANQEGSLNKKCESYNRIATKGPLGEEVAGYRINQTSSLSVCFFFIVNILQ